MYNPKNHYWIVDGSTTQVYSSAASSCVDIGDATYQAWVAAGNAPTEITGNDMLRLRIEFLEAAQTPRRMREAGADDAGGTAAGRTWMSDLDSQIATLRAQMTAG